MDIKLVETLQQLPESAASSFKILLGKLVPSVIKVTQAPAGYFIATSRLPNPEWVEPVMFRGVEYKLGPTTQSGSVVNYVASPKSIKPTGIENSLPIGDR